MLNGIRIRDPSSLVAAETRRRPNGHEDGRKYLTSSGIKPRFLGCLAYSLCGLSYPGPQLGVGTLGCYLDVEETVLNTAEF